MARHTKLRVMNPEFLRYANFEQEFTVPTPAHYGVAWRLVVNYFPGISWRCHYAPDSVWHELEAHQSAFRAVLDGLIAQDLSPAQEGTIRLHVGHFGPHPRWDRSPAHSSFDPEQVVDVEVYGEVFEPQDVLDPLYDQLHLYLRNRDVQDLKRCRSCGRYFLALTACEPLYCDSCRRAEANRKAVQKWRAGETEQDLEEVRAAVQQVRDCGADELIFEELWVQYQEPQEPGNKAKRLIGPRRFRRLLRELLGAELMC